MLQCLKPEQKRSGTLTTGENGKALSNALYLGEYSLKEVSAPTGYVLNKDNHNVSLKYDGQKAEVYIQSETVSNMPQKGIIEISKIDAETDRPIIKGAVYGVYASTDIVVNGDVKYKKDQLVDKVSTDNGKGDSEEIVSRNILCQRIDGSGRIQQEQQRILCSPDVSRSGCKHLYV